MLATVEALSEESLNDPALLPWLKAEPLWRRIAGTGYTHPMVHFTAYLTRHGQAALATRMEEEARASAHSTTHPLGAASSLQPGVPICRERRQ